MIIKTAKEAVIKVLRENQVSRDCDRILTALVWEAQRPELKDSNYATFYKLFTDGKLFHSESIRRNRQKIQEHNKELRGRFYKERKTVQAEETKKELRTYNK